MKNKRKWQKSFRILKTSLHYLNRVFTVHCVCLSAQQAPVLPRWPEASIHSDIYCWRKKDSVTHLVLSVAVSQMSSIKTKELTGEMGRTYGSSSGLVQQENTTNTRLDLRVYANLWRFVPRAAQCCNCYGKNTTSEVDDILGDLPKNLLSHQAWQLRA